MVATTATAVSNASRASGSSYVEVNVSRTAKSAVADASSPTSSNSPNSHER